MLKFHKCTENDMSKFYPVAKQSQELLKDINENDERGFFCIDEDEMEIFGNFSTDNNSHIEFLMLPCNVLFREWGYVGDTVADECVWDLQ